MAESVGENITWNENLEKYFADTGEKAHCFSWLHKKSEELYSGRKNWIDLPVIVGSGVIGFLNAGSSSMFDDPMVSSVALGVGSLVVGILQTINTYFNWSRRAEGHRISAIQYSRLYRFLCIELSLPRDQRMSPAELLKYVKDQYDRLQEISPLVPTSVMKEFQQKFKDEKDISKPEESNGLEKITIYHEDVRVRRSIDVAQSPIPTTINPMLTG